MNERFTGKNLLELPQDFSVVQIETTDLNPTRDQIIEIAANKYRKNKFKKAFEWDSEEDKNDLRDALSQLKSFIGKDTIVINCTAFFRPFMGNAFVNNLGEPFSNDIVDIQRLFRKIENQKSAKLSQMIKFYNLSTSHNLKADEDIKSVEEIYIKLQGEFRKQFKSIKELQPKGSDFRLKDVSGDPAKNDKNNAFYDKYVSATGKLNAYTRKEIAQMINNIGGHFQKNPGEKTDYFVAGKFEGNRGTSNKLEKAKKLPNVTIIHEDDFLDMVAGYEWE